jgi:Lrp/AsnC family transcriptional regulator, leucine-responsive regulatory protein
MLDNTNILILDELCKNSRITMKELGEKVHLTGPATSARVAKLEDKGIIVGYTIKVNQEKIGFIVHAIIHIYTKSTNHPVGHYSRPDVFKLVVLKEKQESTIWLKG